MTLKIQHCMIFSFKTIKCNKCPPLNFKICSYGFKPVKQAKQPNECCDTITCISDPNHSEELSISIGQSSSYDDFTFPPVKDAQAIFEALKSENTFNPSHIDSPSYELQDIEYQNDELEMYVDNYHDLPLKRHSDICQNFTCSSERYKYLRNADKCPEDSTMIQLDGVEEKCCQVKYSCECNVCDAKSKMVEWCKLAGVDFEAILVQEAESVPGKCCDYYICRYYYFLTY